MITITHFYYFSQSCHVNYVYHCVLSVSLSRFLNAQVFICITNGCVCMLFNVPWYYLFAYLIGCIRFNVKFNFLRHMCNQIKIYTDTSHIDETSNPFSK